MERGDHQFTPDPETGVVTVGPLRSPTMMDRDAIDTLLARVEALEVQVARLTLALEALQPA